MPPLMRLMPPIPPLRIPAEAVSKEIAVAEMVKVANSAAVTLLKFRVMALSISVGENSPMPMGRRAEAFGSNRIYLLKQRARRGVRTE
jgi:hypothetical protein